MTDARFPERWLNDRRVLKLSDEEFRLFVVSLVWSVSNRTDGVLEDDDLNLIPKVATRHAHGLMKAGLWKRHDDHWVIQDYASTQTTRDELDRLEEIRRGEREKKARQRAKSRDVSTGQSPGTVPGDDIGQDRPRLGHDKEAVDETSNENRWEGYEGEEEPPVESIPSRSARSSPVQAGLRSVRSDRVYPDAVPCDRCGVGPSRITSSGCRLCGGCEPGGR